MKKTSKASDLLFLPLGGCGEIGMNLNLYGSQGRWLMVDLGITFGDELGIEIIMPDTTFIEEQRDNLLGLVLTHGHEDHIGAVPYLWPRLQCPIYATPFTMALVKEKLKEAGLLNQVPLHEISMGGRIKLEPFEIEFVNLTHSIPEPNALLITTPEGKIFHTGDWKLDPDPLIGTRSDEAYLKAIGDSGVLALVCDSTNVFVEGETESEAEVRASLVELVGKQKGRVAIALFASNVARFESCVYAAMAHQRQVVLVGRSLHRINQAARACGYLKDIPEFLTETEATALPPERVLLICTGSQGEPRAALSRIAEKTHPTMQLQEGDTVIFSSRRIPGNEKAIADLHNKLQRLGLTVITDGQEFTHASGHPGRAELLQMYKLIRPQILVPVHGEEMHLHEQASLGLSSGIKQTIVPHNGSVISFTGDVPVIIDQVHNGRFCRDGNRVVPFFSAHLKERHKLMVSGLVAITFFIDRKGAIDEPEVTLVGIAANDSENAMIHEAILREIAVGIKEAAPTLFYSDKDTKDLLSKATRRAVNNLCGIKPVIVAHVVRAS